MIFETGKYSQQQKTAPKMLHLQRSKVPTVNKRTQRPSSSFVLGVAQRRTARSVLMSQSSVQFSSHNTRSRLFSASSSRSHFYQKIASEKQHKISTANKKLPSLAAKRGPSALGTSFQTETLGPRRIGDRSVWTNNSLFHERLCLVPLFHKARYSSPDDRAQVQRILCRASRSISSRGAKSSKIEPQNHNSEFRTVNPEEDQDDLCSQDSANIMQETSKEKQVAIRYRIHDVTAPEPFLCFCSVPQGAEFLVPSDLFTSLAADGVNLNSIGNIRVFDQHQKAYVKLTSKRLPIYKQGDNQEFVELFLYKRRKPQNFFSIKPFRFFSLGFLYHTLKFDVTIKFKLNEIDLERRYRAVLRTVGPKIDISARIGRAWLVDPVVTKIFFHEPLTVSTGFDIHMFPLSITYARLSDRSMLAMLGTAGLSFGWGVILGGELSPVKDYTDSRQLLESIYTRQFTQDKHERKVSSTFDLDKLLESPDSLLKAETITIEDLRAYPIVEKKEEEETAKRPHL